MIFNRKIINQLISISIFYILRSIIKNHYGLKAKMIFILYIENSLDVISISIFLEVNKNNNPSSVIKKSEMI